MALHSNLFGNKYVDDSSGIKKSFDAKPLVICGPSGSGKSTLLNKLFNEFGDCFGFSISHTTRTPRHGEVNGKDYHFVDKNTMINAIKSGEFIEYTVYSDNYYGTSKSSIIEVQNKGQICILDIETEGVKNLKKLNLNPRCVFISPPNMKVLEQRLRGRGTETEESLLRRLNIAKNEIKYGESKGNFDLIIVNDDIQDAYNSLREFILKDIETLKQFRNHKDYGKDKTDKEKSKSK